MKHRPRRLRTHTALRDMVRENQLSVHDLVYPLFVRAGKGIKEPIPSMPGQYRFSIDTLLQELEQVLDLGIRAILLFGLSTHKDDMASASYAFNGIVCQAIKVIKSTFPTLYLITDVCVCAYTSHGHCGVMRDSNICNDTTLDILAKMAVSHARAGADMVAPSAMMDGQVKSIRLALDDVGYNQTPIMAYSVKYQSAFYGPFRDAANSSPEYGDRSGYQMDVHNAKEALKEIKLDIKQGADIVMVKPAMAYMDIIYRGKHNIDVPMAVYNVSGEYSMIKAASDKKWIDEEKIIMELMISFKRAGADIIITYFAKDVAQILKNNLRY